MVAFTSLCLQLGGASGSGSGDKVVSASTPEELVAARLGLEASSLNKLDVVVLASELGKLYNPMELANWVPFLRVDATVTVKIIGESSDLSPVSTSFVLAGLASSSERREADGSRVLVATRKATATVNAVPLKKQNAVSISLDDNADEDMIDENGLLAEENLLAPPPAMGEKSATDDCSGRKACDNCTCGRADAEVTEKPKNAPKSSCGKCHLGDAFRCASCPYLGLPAFKPGEEHLVLQMADDL